MGNASLTFEHDVDGMDGSGQKVVLSSVIEDLTPEQFWEGMRRFLLTKSPNERYFEVDYKAYEEEDGSIVTCVTLGTVGVVKAIFGKKQGQIWSRYIFDYERNIVKIPCYNYDSTLSEETRTQDAYLKVHTDPLRFEYWVEELNARIAGPFVRDIFAAVLYAHQILCTVEYDQPSLIHPGKKSIVTGPLADQSLTSQQFWEMRKEHTMKDLGGQQLDDGNLIIEQEGLPPFWPSTYQTFSLSEDGNELITRNFGPDETLHDLRQSLHQVMIEGPPKRFEFWLQNYEGRESGLRARFVGEGLVRNVLEFMKKESLSEAQSSS